MLKYLVLCILAGACSAQMNPSGQQPGGFNSGPGSSWQNPQQGPVAGGAPFGQNLPGQNQQQPWMAGSNPQFNANPSFGGSSGQQHPNAMQNIGQIPPNNPPPGTVTGADRALQSGGSNPQWANPQWAGPNQPSPFNQPGLGQPNQFGQGQFGQQQPGGQFGQQQGQFGQQPSQFGQQPGQFGGQPNWNSPGSPNNPQNPNQPSTQYPPGQGRPPWAAAATSRPLDWLLPLTALFCLLRMMA